MCVLCDASETTLTSFADRDERVEMGHARRALAALGKGGERRAWRGCNADDVRARVLIPRAFANTNHRPNQIAAAPGSATPAGITNGQVPNANPLAVGPHTGGQTAPNGLPLSAGVLPARPSIGDDPIIPHNGFQTFEEGEKAFMHLLRKAGVDPTWTWERTMRAIITDPLYRALNSLAEKKAAFEKFTAQLKAKEQEEKEARMAKLRPALRNMLKGNPNVFHYTTFSTANKLFAQHPIWQQARIEAERRQIFEEYVDELKEREIVSNVHLQLCQFLIFFSKKPVPLALAPPKKSSPCSSS